MGVATVKCEQVSELSSWFASGELPPERIAEVEAHLAGCPVCRAEVAAMRRAISALEQPKRCFEAPDVLAAVKREVARPTSPRLSFRLAFAAVGAAVLLIAAWFAVGPKPSNQPPPQQMAVNQVAPRQAPPAPITARDNAPDLSDQSDTSDKSRSPVPPNKPDVRKVRYHRPVYVKRPTQPQQVSPPEPKEAVVQDSLKPTVDYLIVFNPEPSLSSASDSGSESAQNAAAEMPAAPTRAVYSIRMVDQTAGTETNLVIEQEISSDSVDSSTVDYSIKDIKPDGYGKRSGRNEGVRTHPVDNTILG